jgi:LysM repeat protein
MSQQAPAGAEVTPAAPHHSATLDAAFQPTVSPGQLMLAVREPQVQPKAKASSAFPTTYTVRAGDSLSSIAGRYYHNAAAWPVLYWGNRGQVRWADVIKTGQVLRVPAAPARMPAAPAQLGPPAPAQAAAVYTPRHASTAPAQPAPSQAPAPVQAPAPARTGPTSTGSAGTSSGGWPGGAFGECVVQRESGGNPNVWNASGHWGLYQFSASTWAAYGGNPAAFGNAGVAEQEQVFMNALAQGGQSNWAPYDGC